MNPQTIVLNQVWIASPISILQPVVLNQAQTSSLISILKQLSLNQAHIAAPHFNSPNCLESSSDCISHFNPQNNCLESSSHVICHFNPQNTCLESSSDFISHFNPQNKWLESEQDHALLETRILGIGFRNLSTASSAHHSGKTPKNFSSNLSCSSSQVHTLILFLPKP